MPLQVGLVQTVTKVRDAYDPDWVVVEPTGLAVPGDLVDLVKAHVDGLGRVRVLTVVDAERWPMLLEVVEPLVTAQLASADVAAVNKADAVGAGELDAVVESARSLAGGAAVLPVSATTGAGMAQLFEELVG